MPSREKPLSEIKYSEWRPIGVCDEGEWNERKAVMFNAKELALVMAPGVNRHNWHHSPKIKKLIHRCARKVAKLSLLTQSMARPHVAEIKLVGMVLQYQKTPTLNLESEEGKVQLFQIGFVDGGKRKPWFWKAFATVLAALFLFVAVLFLLDLFFQEPEPRKVAMCGERRSAPLYAHHLGQVQGQMKDYFSHMPATFRHRCYFAKGSVSFMEEQVVRCFLTLKKAPPLEAEGASLKKVNQCVFNICQKSLPALNAYCRQLNF